MRAVIASKPKSRQRGADARVASLQAELRALAYRKGPDAKLPTVRELCEALGTSWTSLSEALNQLEAQNVIYRKLGSGIYVSPKLHQKRISVLLDSHGFRAPGASPFWTSLTALLMDKAQSCAETRDEDYIFQIASQSKDPDVMDRAGEELLKGIDAGTIHAVMSVALQGPLVERLMERDVPFVAFAGPGKWTVVGDVAQTTRTGIPPLVEQGCRRIGFWKPSTSYDDMTIEEIEADAANFAECLRESGVPVIDALIRDNRRAPGTETGTLQEQGYRAVQQAFGPDRDAWPDGLLICDDMMTSGALVALQHKGIVVGRDVKIATHANRGSTVLFGHDASLTLLEVDVAGIVDTMFEMMGRLLSGDAPRQGSVSVAVKIKTSTP
jgi:DNA-binding LacI/PurR family transcriptional regulator